MTRTYRPACCARHLRACCDHRGHTEGGGNLQERDPRPHQIGRIHTVRRRIRLAGPRPSVKGQRRRLGRRLPGGRLFGGAQPGKGSPGRESGAPTGGFRANTSPTVTSISAEFHAPCPHISPRLGSPQGFSATGSCGRRSIYLTLLSWSQSISVAPVGARWRRSTSVWRWPTLPGAVCH